MLQHGPASTGTRARGSPAGITHLGSALHPSGPQMELAVPKRGVTQPSHLCPGLGATSFLPFSWWGSSLWPWEGGDVGLEDQPQGQLNQSWWSSGSAAGFLGVSPIFYYFFLLGGGFLLPSRFNKLTPPSSPCQYEQPEAIPPFKSNSGLASKWTSNVKYRFSSR